MADLSGAQIRRLTATLLKLPDTKTRSDRHDSWMTAEQIRKFLKLEITAEQVDERLLVWWEKHRRDSKIRPAKYPSLTTALRLWGHVKRVGKAPKDLEPRNLGSPVTLEPLESLPIWAPQAFVSYAFRDLHLAARLRLHLAYQHGIRCWLASEMLERDDLIFEGVRAALTSSQLVIVLITAQSLGSAWMSTELETALGFLGDPSGTSPMQKMIFAFDASDKRIEAVVEKHVLGQRNLDGDLLDPLLVAFALTEHDEHRRSQYRHNAERILSHARRGVGSVTLYPGPVASALRGIPSLQTMSCAIDAALKGDAGVIT